MEHFWNFLIAVVVCLTVLAVVFAILLSLPQSRFRSFILEITGWTGAAAAVAGVLSPIDLIPDFIVGLGQMDDILYIVGGILSAIVAFKQHRWRAQQQNDKLVHINLIKEPKKG